MYSRDDLHLTIQRLSTLRMYMQPRVVPTEFKHKGATIRVFKNYGQLGRN
jgi:hypothetical protein